jgi:alanine racemase
MGKNVSGNGRPVWGEISLAAIAHNLRAIRRHIGAGRKVLGVVKANAYGHGAVPVARTLARAGVECFGVTSTAEGAELREAGIRQPILVLSGFWPGEEKELVRYRLTPAIHRVEQLALLDRALRRARVPARLLPWGVHAKFDTGMNRLGIAPAGVRAFVEALATCSGLRLEGVFTHFASSEDFSSGQTGEQERVFASVLAELKSLRLRTGMVHLANSAAIVLRPSTWADMVRPGALLYGYHQFYEPPEREQEAHRTLRLRPAFSLRARIISLREVPAGQGVGYNARFRTTRPSRIAILAAGYADGFVRRLGNSGKVLIRGRCAPIVGTVSMDLTAVDVTNLPEAGVGDVATLFGVTGRGACPPIYASDVARSLGTVTSDLLCSVGSRVPRVYLD